jgi:hypothetical protein
VTVTASSEAATDKTQIIDTLYRRTFPAPDSSDRTNIAMHSALALTELTANSTITNSYTDAAQSHDRLDLKMKGSLQDRYFGQVEQYCRKPETPFVRRLTRKREVHVAEIGKVVLILNYQMMLPAHCFDNNGPRTACFSRGLHS